MKKVHFSKHILFIIFAIFIVIMFLLFSTTLQSRLSDSNVGSYHGEHVQSKRQPSQAGKTSPDVAKTYKPMKNVSGPTGLNPDTRYREMMERDKEESSE